MIGLVCRFHRASNSDVCVERTWRMLQHHEPAVCVVTTGTTYAVYDALQFPFDRAGLRWEEHVKLNERYPRLTEAESLGDASKAAEVRRWKPRVLAPVHTGTMVSDDIDALN